MSAILDSKLQHTQSALQQHRSQAGQRRIPDGIRREAIALLKHHSRCQVVRGLGISYGMLRQWEEALGLGSLATAAESSSAAGLDTVCFVELPCEVKVESEPEPEARDVLSGLELSLSADVAVRFKGGGAVNDCLHLLIGLGYGRQGVSA